MLVPLLALAAAAQAPAASADLSGIWEGTVGALPVRACFAQRDYGTFGAYYYLSRLRLIALETEDGLRGGFREGAGGGAGPAPGGPRWRIERAAGGQLTARWTQGRRTLPVRLHRVARVAGEAGPCGSIVFHQPRLAGVRTVSARAAVDGVAYTRLALDHGGRFNVNVQSFALDGDGEAVRRLNATLGAPLNGNPPDWLDCIRGGLDHLPYEGEWEQNLTPTLISRRWLDVTEQSGGYCGGAHPDWGSIHRTFDLTTGREINLHDWLTAAAVKRERYDGSDEVFKTLQPAFRDFILRGWHPDPQQAECDEVIRMADFWNIGLTRDGLTFSPNLPHVVQACGEEFTVELDRLRPWLTADGAALLGALHAEPAGARARAAPSLPTVGFVVPGRRGGAVILPESAVQTDGNGNYVYILDPNGTVVRRDVAIGRVGRRGVVIGSGLTGDERVVLAASPFLNPGERVLPEPVRPGE